MEMETKIRGRIATMIFKYVAVLELENSLWEIKAYSYDDVMCGVNATIENNKCERVRSLRITSEYVETKYEGV